MLLDGKKERITETWDMKSFFERGDK